MRILIPFVLVLSGTILSSCASTRTQQKQYERAVPLAQEGSYLAAAEVIEKAKDKAYKEKDRVLFYLDRGMLLHWAGEYEASNEALTAAEYAIEELFTKSVSKALVSGVLNDNALDYAGEDYEDIYLNVFKALNYIALNDEEAALVEIRRVQLKLDLLEDKYKDLVDEYNSSGESEGTLSHRELRFHNDILARYLSLILYRSEGSYDDARIDREAMDEAWASQRQIYNFEKPDFPRANHQEGAARVNILSFSGLGPIKLADTLMLHSLGNIVYVSMSGQSEDYVERMLGFTFIPVPGIPDGMHFRIQFPRLSGRQTAADKVVVKLDGTIAAELKLLEDMDAIARETFALKQPLTVGKTIIRATVKNISKEVGKQALNESLADQGGGAIFAGLLAGLAADIAVDATENADLRISHFFPSHAWAAEFDALPGAYEVTVEYWNGNRLMGTTDHGTMEFASGGLNLIESYILQ